MLDNLLERAVAALESIADSLELIAGNSENVKSDGEEKVIRVEPVAQTVAEAKEKKPRGTSRKKPEPAAAEPPAPTEPEAPATAPAFAGSTGVEPMTLEQCNSVLIERVNEGVPASAIMDILAAYSPQQNLRFIDAVHYPEIAARVKAL